MSKNTYILDAGHGGMVNGKPVTNGKRSPKLPDGTVLYEGVNNRLMVEYIKKQFLGEGIRFYDCVSSEYDVPLTTRVNRANKLNEKTPCVYLSIHSDAFGDGSKWNDVSGIGIYTSKGNTKSDSFASLFIEELFDNFNDTINLRIDTTDGDKDKEEDFYVLKKTNCPAILCEFGFHTNLKETIRMQKDDWRNTIAKSLIYAIKKFEHEN